MLTTWVPNLEVIDGNDVAGYIEAVGAGVTEFKKGDKAAAMTVSPITGGKWGAYAEYSTAPAISTYKFNTTSFEEMATVPLAFMTAALGLFVRIGLDTPPEDGSMAPSKGQVVVINGASSSVGSYGVQLAKHAGYTVVGVARQSADVATELGANKIINYWGKDDSQLVGELKEAVGALGGQLAGALDCVSTTETNLVIAKVVAAFGGGKMSHVLPTDVVKDPSLLPEGVSTLDSAVFDAQDKDAEFAAKWYRLIGKWIDSGKFKPNKVKIVPGGLDGVVEGLKLLENNQVNGVKLVYRISETKST